MSESDINMESIENKLESIRNIERKGGKEKLLGFNVNPRSM